jgi:alkanesulfonate monooxygenase SsuD/methylene tetrahydromethanopterin reductase-like flavin-dependent oxidoreductase (luciferase family)
MVKPIFGWAVPTFGGINDTHIDTPLIDMIDFRMIKEVAQLCEEEGYDKLWVADHLILGRSSRILEAWTVMSCLATLTHRVKIGSKVLCYAFRHPSILAKMVSTLDAISNGRVEIGLGAGWNEEEAKRYGIAFPAISTRIEQLEEYIIVLKKMLTESSPTFSGKYYTIEDAVCEPKPIQKPHPPLWIGTLRGGKKMFNLIASYADGINTFGTLSSVKEKIERIFESCKAIGRSVQNLKISCDTHVLIGRTDDEVREKKREINKYNPNYPSYLYLSPDARQRHGIPDKMSWEEYEELYLIGRPDKIIKRLEEFIDIGVNEFVLWFLYLPHTDDIKLFSKEVMSSFI